MQATNHLSEFAGPPALSSRLNLFSILLKSKEADTGFDKRLRHSWEFTATGHVLIHQVAPNMALGVSEERRGDRDNVNKGKCVI